MENKNSKGDGLPRSFPLVSVRLRMEKEIVRLGKKKERIGRKAAVKFSVIT